MKFMLLIFVVSVAYSGRKFCPGERDGDQCRAKSNATKCAAFFDDLKGNGNHNLTWIAALPDALRRWPMPMKDIMGKDINRSKFYGIPFCHLDFAFGLCYSSVLKLAREPL